MSNFLFFLGMGACFILGAIAHERDIAEQCRKHGHSAYAGWTVTINCKEDKRP